MRLAKSQAHQPFPGFFKPGFLLSNHRCKSLLQGVCPDSNRAFSFFGQMHSASALFESRRSGGRLQGAGGFQWHCRADDRDLSLLCGLCRRRFLRTHGRAGKNDPQCSAADRGVCAGSGQADPAAGRSLGTSRAGTDNVISECFLRQNLSTFDAVFQPL